ncbi:hypothetical protein HPC49_17020 [Pyxidicoccus fallax]|uniref:Lipoprotein n=1 Tax=Pyxidicoccus fallax TaxID=394095 RepID=A0A848L6X5_9BACT|nr:hypothetical protein [Pyxidicoccus fallax]NMO14277.1 hypothetical protein [Pyxidicoccus fallax]NPC79918.1 hypothetical protein [Pyxidicoccus fallax]
MRTRSVLPLYLLLVSVAACSGAQKAGDPSQPPPPPDTPVEVRNLKTVDVNLYALSPTRRLRLGTVPGMTTRSFVIPHQFLGDMDYLRFGMEVIGSDAGALSEQQLPVRPGEQLSLTIQ